MKRAVGTGHALGPTAHRLFVVLAVTAVGVPLLVTPGFTLFYDITPKVVLLLIGVAVTLLLPRTWVAGVRVLWRDSLGRLLLAAFAVQLASLVLSTVFSVQPDVSFAGSNWRRFGFVTQGGVILFAAVCAGYLAAQPDRWLKLTRLLTMGGLVAAVYGVLQYFGIDPLLPASAYHFGEGERTIVRTPGTLGHAGYFSTYLLAVVFWSLAVRTSSSGPWKILATVTAAAGSFAIVLSGTRAALLALVIGAGVVMIWKRSRLDTRLLLGSVLALCTLAGFYVSPWGQKLRGRVQWSIEDAGGGGRLLLWRDSVDMFAGGPWLTGSGLETYSAEFPRFLSAELASAYPNRYYESPHNVFLDALTAQGLLGFLPLAAMCLVALAAAWRLKGARSAAGVWIAAAFVAGLASNQFVAFTAPTALYFLLSVVLLVAAAALENAPGDVDEARAGGDRKVPLWAWLSVAPLSGLLVVFALQLASADRLLARVNDRATVDLRDAIAAYERARNVQPWGMRTDLWFSRLMLAAASRDGTSGEQLVAFQAATQAGERAARQAVERQAALYNLAVLYGLQNKVEQAEAALRDTITVAPNWYKPHWTLARVLYETGRLDEALHEAELAVELNGGANPEVVQTLDQLRDAAGGGDM